MLLLAEAPTAAGRSPSTRPETTKAMNRRLWANLLALASPMVPCEVAGSSVPLGDLVNNFCFRETPNPIAVLHRVPRSLVGPQGHDHQPLQGQAADEFSHHCFEP